ncbi:hypothetical protein JCM16303_000501 [Sporobolomyces ruberrimus]
MVALDNFCWEDVRLHVIYTLSTKSPAALGFPVETIFNVLFSATDPSSPKLKGLKINVLDGAIGTPALLQSEFDEIWDNTVEVFKGDQSLKLPLHQGDAIHNATAYLTYVLKLTADDDFSPRTLLPLGSKEAEDVHFRSGQSPSISLCPGSP